MHALARDADPGVRDPHLELGLPATQRPARDPHHDLALVRELDRVREEVDQHLAHSPGVTHHHGRTARVHVASELELPLRRLEGNEVEALLDAALDVERVLLELELAGLDLGEIQDVALFSLGCQNKLMAGRQKPGFREDS